MWLVGEDGEDGDGGDVDGGADVGGAAGGECAGAGHSLLGPCFPLHHGRPVQAVDALQVQGGS